MNRKIIISGLSIVASLAMLGGSAFAAFTTQAIASGNTFSSGTDSLLISNAIGGPFTASILSPFTGVNVTPGTTNTYTFFLKNDNTTSTDNLAVTASFANGSGDPGLENNLSTQFSCNDPLNGVTTPGAFSVSAMLSGSVGLGTINSGEVATCTLTVSLPANADNTVAGKTTTFDVDFNATGSVPTPTLTP